MMANKPESKRPHSEVEPDTPPNEFSMLKMKILMEELFEKQFEKLGMDEIKKDIKSIKKDMPKLKEKVEKMDTDIKAMENSIEFVEKSCKEAKTASACTIKEVELLKGQVLILEEQLKKEREMRINLEYEQKKSNLICSGLPEDMKTKKNPMERIMMVEDVLKPKLDLNDLGIIKCSTINSHATSKGGSTALVQFRSIEEREKVWANRRKLKGTNLILREDLPQEMANRAKKLAPIMAEARRQKVKAHLVKDKLYINDKMYTCDTLKDLPPSLLPSTTATKIEDNHMFFFSHHTPLSNFHSKENMFTENGLSFRSTEQYYCWHKARYFKDKTAELSILSEKNPRTIKRTPIKGYNHQKWNSVSHKIMEQALSLKFTQDSECKKCLFSMLK